MVRRYCELLLCICFLLVFVGCTKNENEESIFLNEYSDIDILEKIVKKLEMHNYYIASTGVTKAKLGLISYTQNTDTAIYYQNNEFYNIVNSTSTLVSHQHRLYVKDNLVKYMDSDKKSLGLIETNVNEYLLEYGKIPTHDSIFNYVITSDTIMSCNRNFTNNSYQITYNLDPVKAVVNITKQMKVFGGLLSEPEFKSVSLTISFDEEFNLLQYSSIEDYVIMKKVITDTKMDCHQELNSVVYLENYNKPSLTDFFS